MDRFITFLLALYGAAAISPLIGGKIPTIWMLIFLILLLCLIVGRMSTVYIAYKKSLLNSIFSFCFITLSYKLLNISSAEIGNVYNQISFWCNIIFAIYVINYIKKTNGLFLTLFLWVISLYTIVSNIFIYSIYGDIVGTVMEDVLYGTNFGGTTFNTLSFVFFTANYYVLLNVKDKRIRLMTLIGALISMYYMFFCGARGTVVLLDFFIILILPATILVYKNKISKIGTISFFAVFGIIYLFLEETIHDFLISIAPDRLAYRFNDLKTSFDNGINDSSFSGRFGLYKVSINSFFSSIKSFFIGIGDHRGTLSGDGLSYSEVGIGGHSEVLDQCARFGLLGIFITYKILKKVKVMFSTVVEDDLQAREIKNILLAFFICACIKSVLFPNIGFAMFVIFPLAIKFEQYINEKIWL